MSVAIKKNKGWCYEEKSWKEMPGYGKRWRDNYDAIDWGDDTSNEETPPKKQTIYKTIEPHPGTEKAQKAGCRCPVIDNEFGRGYCGQPGVYVYSAACPIHCSEEDIE